MLSALLAWPVRGEDEYVLNSVCAKVDESGLTDDPRAKTSYKRRAEESLPVQMPFPGHVSVKQRAGVFHFIRFEKSMS